MNRGTAMTNCAPPTGLYLTREFVTPERESALIEAIDNGTWNNALKRRTQHYGYEYNYRTGQAGNPTLPIPELFLDTPRLLVGPQRFDSLPDQVIVNEYNIGQGISAHTDSPSYGDVIFGVSLGEDTIMKFTKSPNCVFMLHIPRRSIFMMSGEARNMWKHEIPSWKTYYVNGVRYDKRPEYRRLSITYRTLRK